MERDAFSVEIFANLFKAIVDEMGWVVLRSSHTTFVKETQDFAVALVSLEGETIAYPYDIGATPIMGVPMHAATRAFDDWQPGDVMITNDPYTTGGMVMHLNDLYLFRPIFVDGKLLCFAWAFIHCTDVGGYAPGSIDMQNRDVFQEGLRLRPVRLYRAGVFNREVWQIFADNCRIPDPNWGDMTACMAALERAEHRLSGLVARHGRNAVAWAMGATIDRTERIARDVLKRIPKGEYSFVEFFEDDYVSEIPVRLAVTLRSSGDGHVVLDYTGSDPQVAAALNLPTGSMRRHPFLCLGLTNFVVTQTESIHINSGIIRCIDLVLPDASVVNASFPAACGMRFTTAMRIHDLVLGALSLALPGQVPAGGGNAVVITYIATAAPGGTGRVVVANPVPSGSAGGPSADGVSGTDFSVAFLRNVPVEVLEAEAPVLIRTFALTPDSEGAGRLRGGFGLNYELEIREPGAVVVMRGKDRHRFSAWGIQGGEAAEPGGNVSMRDGETHSIGKQTVYRPALNEVIRLWSGGGGGYGDPLDRDPQAVADDVTSSLVTVQRAKRAYGVVLSGGAVDKAATDAARAELRRARPAPVAFDFGPARREWEHTHGAAPARIAEWLAGLPSGVRREAQTLAYRRLHETGAGPYGIETIERVIAGTATSLRVPEAG